MTFGKVYEKTRIWILLVIAIILPMTGISNYWLHVLNIGGIFAICTLSLNLLTGCTGLFGLSIGFLGGLGPLSGLGGRSGLGPRSGRCGLSGRSPLGALGGRCSNFLCGAGCAAGSTRSPCGVLCSSSTAGSSSSTRGLRSSLSGR